MTFQVNGSAPQDNRLKMMDFSGYDWFNNVLVHVDKCLSLYKQTSDGESGSLKITNDLLSLLYGSICCGMSETFQFNLLDVQTIQNLNHDFRDPDDIDASNQSRADKKGVLIGFLTEEPRGPENCLKVGSVFFEDHSGALLCEIVNWRPEQLNQIAILQHWKIFHQKEFTLQLLKGPSKEKSSQPFAYIEITTPKTTRFLHPSVAAGPLTLHIPNSITVLSLCEYLNEEYRLQARHPTYVKAFVYAVSSIHRVCDKDPFFFIKLLCPRSKYYLNIAVKGHDKMHFWYFLKPFHYYVFHRLHKTRIKQAEKGFLTVYTLESRSAISYIENASERVIDKSPCSAVCGKVACAARFAEPKVINYEGTVTSCAMARSGVYEIDYNHLLIMSHHSVPHFGRGLRVDAKIQIFNVHPMRYDEDTIVLFCCTLSTIKMKEFSDSNAPYEPFVHQRNALTMRCQTVPPHDFLQGVKLMEEITQVIAVPDRRKVALKAVEILGLRNSSKYIDAKRDIFTEFLGNNHECIATSAPFGPFYRILSVSGLLSLAQGWSAGSNVLLRSSMDPRESLPEHFAGYGNDNRLWQYVSVSQNMLEKKMIVCGQLGFKGRTGCWFLRDNKEVLDLCLCAESEALLRSKVCRDDNWVAIFLKEWTCVVESAILRQEPTSSSPKPLRRIYLIADLRKKLNVILLPSKPCLTLTSPRVRKRRLSSSVGSWPSSEQVRCRSLQHGLVLVVKVKRMPLLKGGKWTELHYEQCLDCTLINAITGCDPRTCILSALANKHGRGKLLTYRGVPSALLSVSSEVSMVIPLDGHRFGAFLGPGSVLDLYLPANLHDLNDIIKGMVLNRHIKVNSPLTLRALKTNPHGNTFSLDNNVEIRMPVEILCTTASCDGVREELLSLQRLIDNGELVPAQHPRRFASFRAVIISREYKPARFPFNYSPSAPTLFIPGLGKIPRERFVSLAPMSFPLCGYSCIYCVRDCIYPDKTKVYFTLNSICFIAGLLPGAVVEFRDLLTKFSPSGKVSFSVQESSVVTVLDHPGSVSPTGNWTGHFSLRKRLMDFRRPDLRVNSSLAVWHVRCRVLGVHWAKLSLTCHRCLRQISLGKCIEGCNGQRKMLAQMSCYITDNTEEALAHMEDDVMRGYLGFTDEEWVSLVAAVDQHGVLLYDREARMTAQDSKLRRTTPMPLLSKYKSAQLLLNSKCRLRYPQRREVILECRPFLSKEGNKFRRRPMNISKCRMDLMSPPKLLLQVERVYPVNTKTEILRLLSLSDQGSPLLFP